MAGTGNTLSVQTLLASPLVKQYFPAGLSSGVFTQQLRDPALVYLDLDTLCEMEEDALRALVRATDTAQDADADFAPEEDAAPEDAEESLPQSADECVVLSVDEMGLVAKMKLLEPPGGINPPGTREMLRALFRKKPASGWNLSPAWPTGPSTAAFSVLPRGAPRRTARMPA